MAAVLWITALCSISFVPVAAEGQQPRLCSHNVGLQPSAHVCSCFVFLFVFSSLFLCCPVILSAPSGPAVVNGSYNVSIVSSDSGALAVNFTVADEAAAVCSVDAADTLTESRLVRFLAVGNCTVHASVPDDVYAGGEVGSLTFPVLPRFNNTVRINTTFPRTGALAYKSDTYNFTATTTSGEAPLWSLAATSGLGVCSVTEDGVASFIAAGTCVLRASVPASGIYAAGTSTFSFAVSQITGIVTITAVVSFTFRVVGDTYQPVYTTNSPEAVPTWSISANPTVCSIDSVTGLVTYLQSSSCTIRVTLSAATRYTTATHTQTISSIRKPGSINFTSTPPIVGSMGLPYTAIAATNTGNGLNIAWTSNTSAAQQSRAERSVSNAQRRLFGAHRAALLCDVSSLCALCVSAVCSLSTSPAVVPANSSSKIVNFQYVVGDCVVTATSTNNAYTTVVATQTIGVKKRNTITAIAPANAVAVNDTVEFKAASTLNSDGVTTIADPNLTFVLTSGNGTYCSMDEQGRVTGLALRSQPKLQKRGSSGSCRHGACTRSPLAHPSILSFALRVCLFCLPLSLFA